MNSNWYKKRGLLYLHRRNEAILSLHLSEKPHAEIARKFEINRTRVEQIVAKALRVMKQKNDKKETIFEIN